MKWVGDDVIDINKICECFEKIPANSENWQPRTGSLLKHFCRSHVQARIWNNLLKEVIDVNPLEYR